MLKHLYDKGLSKLMYKYLWLKMIIMYGIRPKGLKVSGWVKVYPF